MLFLLIVFLAVVLLTAFYATQGLLSSLMGFIAAVFASLLAMGLFEELVPVVSGYWPHLARGVSFMGVFAIAFAICRFAADFAVPKNIKLPKLIDASSGGIVGFFAALVIVGTSVLGLQMLPVHTTILNFGGDQEYANEGRMQGAQQGQVVQQDTFKNLPQYFTISLWNGASGRSLGGKQPFTNVHPDLPMESYGYRNVPQYGSNPVLVPELLTKVEGPYVTDQDAILQKCSIPPGYQAAIIRIEVSKGTESPKISNDYNDNYFRITPTQIRVVTNTGKQHYPIGLLARGTKFEPKQLDKDYVVEDYTSQKVIQDWVFQLDKDEYPVLLEVKQLARVELPVKEKSAPLAMRPASDYPKRAYLDVQGSITVNAAGESKPMANMSVRLVRPSIDVDKIDTAKTRAASNIESIREGGDTWNAALGKPGVPAKSEVEAAYQSIVNIGTANQVRWEEMIPPLMMWKLEPSGARNHTELPAHFRNNIVPLLKDSQVAITTTDPGGKALFDAVVPGDYCVIAEGTSDGGTYCVWVAKLTLEKKGQASVTLNPGTARFKLTAVK